MSAYIHSLGAVLTIPQSSTAPWYGGKPPHSCLRRRSRSGYAFSNIAGIISFMCPLLDSLYPLRLCDPRSPGRNHFGHCKHYEFFPSLRAHAVAQGLGAIATATGYMIGLFKLRYPHVHNMADAGEILAGPIGREVLGGAQAVFMIFICGSHVLTGLIAFDTSKHAVFVTRRALLTFSYAVTAGASCSVLWAAVAAIICLVLTLPRTLNGISYMSVVSFISIISMYRVPMRKTLIFILRA